MQKKCNNRFIFRWMDLPPVDTAVDCVIRFSLYVLLCHKHVLLQSKCPLTRIAMLWEGREVEENTVISWMVAKWPKFLCLAVVTVVVVTAGTYSSMQQQRSREQQYHHHCLRYSSSSSLDDTHRGTVWPPRKPVRTPLAAGKNGLLLTCS